jgi:succinate dehydrogenase / fumarate reductase flavoprotein subunit
MILDSKIPAGPLAEKWTKHKFSSKLVNPANKRKYDVMLLQRLPLRNWVTM